MFSITPKEFVQRSLDLNLFFLRIMKEHSFSLQAAFVPRNGNLSARAGIFRHDFQELLEKAVELADGNVSRAVLDSGEVVTDNTIEAEKRTQFLSGIPFNTVLTKREAQLRSGPGDPDLVRKIEKFNQQVIRETMALVDFKTEILKEVLECRLFTWNFPLLIEHIRREAKFFIAQLQRLQKRIALDPAEEIIQEKVFWDRIMAEHSLFIAHLLDPTEKNLIATADDFARQFFKLESRAKHVKPLDSQLSDLILDEINATEELREFKNAANEMILACKIRSIIIPLLADHVLREANHFHAILTRYVADKRLFSRKKKR